MNLSYKVKSDLFNRLVSENAFVGKIDRDDGLLTFLSEIWSLREMPSEDGRFHNAYDDIFQHTVNNYDWDLKELFVDRLDLLNDDNKYKHFLEKLISSEFCEEEKKDKLISIINLSLEKAGYALVIVDFDIDEKPIYQILPHHDLKVPIDIPPNKLPFWVENEPTGRSHLRSSHTTPIQTPSILLVYNDWDDFGNRTQFSMFYYESSTLCTYVGEIKITDGSTAIMKSELPVNFTQLDKKYASLGQNEQFYQNIREKFSSNFPSVLYALRDASYYYAIQEEFETTKVFKESLLRFDEAEQMLRLSKQILFNRDLDNLFFFRYIFKPPYSTEELPIDFNFSKRNGISNRISALIGKNGTGKTQLISTLPRMILEKNSSVFEPDIPLFSKIIAVSYSFFDSFEIPKSTSLINYHYCGLLKSRGEILTESEKNQKFIRACELINKFERVFRWKSILKGFIEEDILTDFTDSDWFSEKIKIENVTKIRYKLSSGQNIILNIVTDIISNIRYDSLLLFDEPETHLHPNAISHLISI